MNVEFRKCKYSDIDFILKLKELCFKWYIEIIYGWDINIQREKTIHELDKHINDMRIIKLDNKDIGVTTFYETEGTYVVGLIIIHPDYQNKGIATNIIKEYIDGSSERQCQFVFASRVFFNTSENKQNINNLHLFEKIANWLEENTKNNILPKLNNKQNATSIKATSSGYLYGTDNSNQYARYQIQCQLIYEEEE